MNRELPATLTRPGSMADTLKGGGDVSQSTTRPWFRFYTEAVFDPKLRRQRPEYRWLFVVVLSMARRSPKPGWLMLTDLQPVELDDLVDAASMARRSVSIGMAALVSIGVVGRQDGVWFVPQWDQRQYESDVSTERVKRHRERARNVSRNVSESDQSTETDTETELTPKSPRSGDQHEGQHRNCRQCGTNPRAAEKPPPPDLELIIEPDPDCPLCGGSGGPDHEVPCECMRYRPRAVSS